MRNEDRDELIWHAYKTGMKKVRIAYLFKLSVGRISKIIAQCEYFAQFEDLSDVIFSIAPTMAPFLNTARKCASSDWQFTPEAMG